MLNIFIFNVSANTEFNETNLPVEDCEYGFIFETNGKKYEGNNPDFFAGISDISSSLNIYYANSLNALLNVADKYNIVNWKEDYIIELPDEPEVDINDVIDNAISLFSTDENINLIDKNNEEAINENSNSDMHLVNDPWFEWQWYYEAVHADAYRNNGIDGTGVKIGIIDSGFNLDLDDFNYDNIHVINVPALIDNNEERINYFDDDVSKGGHGVPVTSIIAAKTNNEIGIAGITENVTVYVFKVEDDECSFKAQASAYMKAYALAGELGCQVTNNSSGPISGDANEEKIVNNNAKNGMIQVAAIGNNGNPISAGDKYNAYSYPAAYTNVIAVGGCQPDIRPEGYSYIEDPGNFIDRSNPLWKEQWNFTDEWDKIITVTTYRRSDIKNNPDITYKYSFGATANDSIFVSAPNSYLQLYGKDNKLYSKSGTSFSSPIVAAAAIGVKQMRPYVDVDMFKEILKVTSVDLEEEGYDVKTGWGMVDFRAIYDYVSQMPETILEATPNIAIDYTNHKLIGFEDGSYTVNGTIIDATDNSIAIQDDWYGTSISVVKKASGDYHTDSEPQILVIPSVSDGPNTIATDYNTIIGIDDTMEYKKQTSSEWVTGTNETITGLKAGSYDVRFKATDASFASKATTVIIEDKPKVKEDTPNIIIDFDKSILSGFIDGCEYLVNGAKKTSNSGCVALDTAYYGKVITIQKKASDEEHLDSDIQELSVPAIPSAPDFKYEIIFNDEGTVTDVKGITDDMEYRKQGANNWNSGSITSSGKYEIRYKATDSSFASEVCLAEFNDQEPTSEYNVETKLNYENSTIRYEYYNFTGADIYATGVIAVYDSNGRFIGMRTIDTINKGKNTGSFYMAGDIKTIKFFIWDDLQSLKPYQNAQASKCLVGE